MRNFEVSNAKTRRNQEMQGNPANGKMPVRRQKKKRRRVGACTNQIRKLQKNACALAKEDALEFDAQ